MTCRDCRYRDGICEINSHPDSSGVCEYFELALHKHCNRYNSYDGYCEATGEWVDSDDKMCDSMLGEIWEETK